MRGAFLLFALLTAPVALSAQETPPSVPATPEARPHGDALPEAGAPDVERGFDLLGEGARSLLRGLRDETAPHLRAFRDSFGEAFSEVEPEIRRLLEMLGDLRHYEPPERLPNGDVLIRRSPDAPPYEPPAGDDGAPPQDVPQDVPPDDTPSQDEPIEL